MIKSILTSAFSLSLLLLSTANAQEKQFQSATDIAERGVNFYAAEDFENAFKAFREVNYNDTAYYSFTVTAISCANELKSYDSILAICNEVLADSRYNPYRESFMISKSHALIQLEREQESLDFLVESLIEFPKSAIMRYNKSVLLYDFERYDEAIATLQEAIRYNPRHYQSHFKLGLMCAEAGDLTKAALSLNMAIYMGAGTENVLGYIGVLEKVYYNTTEKNIGKVSYREDEDFEEIDDLIRNRTALQKAYKVPGKLQFDFIRANHLLFDQIVFDTESKSFWNENYVRFFKEIYKDGEFTNFSMFESLTVDNPKTQKEIAKNKAKIIAAMDEIGNDFGKFMYERSVWNGSGYDENFLNHYGLYGFNFEAKKNDEKIVGPYTSYYDSGIKESEGTFDSDGLQDGVWKFYDEEGYLVADVTLDNGKLSGLRTSYFENGSRKEQYKIKNDEIDGEVKVFTFFNQVKRQTFYVNGEENGESKSFYNTGEIYTTYTVKNGMREGKTIEYYHEGQIMSEANYSAGILNGDFVSYYRNGVVRSKGQFENDLSVGHWQYRYANNQLKDEGDYKAGYRIGLWKTFSKNGKLSEETNYGETGKKVGVYKEYDLDENLLLELTYKGEEIISFKTYDASGKVLNEGEKKRNELEFERRFPNGVVQSKGNYIRGEQVGIWSFYNQFGVLTSEEEFNENGELDGESREYFDNGQIEIRSIYKDGLRDGYFVDYYKNGQIFKDGFFVEDERQGEWNYYDRDGNMMFSEFYSEGSLLGDVRYYDEKQRLREISTFFYGNLERIRTYDTTGVILRDVKLTDGKFSDAEFTDVAGNVNLKKSYLGGETNGEVVRYFKGGEIRSKGIEIDGLENGKWAWFYENGTPQTTGSYEYGVRTGEWKWFHENGKVETIINYVDGNIEGYYVSYYDNGKMEVEKTYRQDEQHGTNTYYDESGEIQMLRYYSDGRLLGYSYLGADKKPIAMIPFDLQGGVIESYYHNGKKSYYSERKDGYMQGKSIEYHFNGEECTVYHYDKSEQEGVQKEFYSNGNLKSETAFVDGEEHGTSTEYYENGKIKLTESYIYGTRYGWSTSFKADGSVDKKRYYYDGNEL